MITVKINNVPEKFLSYNDFNPFSLKIKSIIKYKHCRVSLYLLGLLYTFLAVFMVADIFMCAIDSITTATKKVKITNESGVMEVILVFFNYKCF